MNHIFRKSYCLTSLVVLISILMCFTSVSGVVNAQNISVVKITIDSKTVDVGENSAVEVEVAPWKTESGIVMTPLRVITEAFGCSVSWNHETKVAGLEYSKKDISIMVKIGYQFATIEYGNGIKSLLALPEKPTIRESRTFIPLEFFAVAFDASVVDEENDSYSIKIK